MRTRGTRLARYADGLTRTRTAVTHILRDQVSRRKAPHTLATVALALLLSAPLVNAAPYQAALPLALTPARSSSSMTTMGPPPNCMLTNPAFCDNFQTISAGGRGGDLDPAKWSFARLSHRTDPSGNLWFDAILNPTNVQFCRTLRTDITPDRDSFFCNGNGQEVTHWMESVTSSSSAGGYQVRDARIRQPFDFAGRTGTIAFDVDAKNTGGSVGWVEVWLTQDPVSGPHNPNDVELGAMHVKNGIGFVFNNDCNQPQKAVTLGRIDIFNNYAYHAITPAKVDCARTMADMFNHVEVRVSQNAVQVWASDYSPDHGGTFPAFRLIATATNLSLPFTRGYVHLQHSQFGLYASSNTSITYHWLGVGFDGPKLAADRAYDVPDALTPGAKGRFAPGINVGYRLPVDGSSGMQTCCVPGTATVKVIPPFVLHNVDLTNVTQARLDLSMWMWQPCWSSSKITLLYRFNGNAWRQYPYQWSDCPQFHYHAYSIPVALSDLQSGSNTLELSSYGDPNNPPIVANIDLTLQGTFPPAAPEPMPTPLPMGVPVPNPYPRPSPNLTAQMILAPSSGTYAVGDSFPVTLRIDGGGKTFNAAAATVNVSPNLAVQSVATGNCAMNYITFSKVPNLGTVPRTSDPSFGGTVAGSTHACTLYTLQVKAIAAGAGSIMVTSGSVQATGSSAEILSAVTNGDYMVNGPGGAGFPTPTPTMEMPMGTATASATPVPPTAPATPGPEGTGWHGADIGAPTPTGSDSLTAGTWTVQGSGADIWGTADQFHSVAQTLTGDGSLSARVLAQTDTSPWAKAGVMLRQSSAPDAPYYFAFVTPHSGVDVQYRAAAGTAARQLVQAWEWAPLSLRVTRVGNTFSTALSHDGVTWTTLRGAQVTLALPASLLGGLAVTSHASGVLSTATFTALTLSPAAPGAPTSTSTATPVSPTTTVSATPVSPTGTSTATPGAPTSTSTATPVPPTATASGTALPMATMDAGRIGPAVDPLHDSDQYVNNFLKKVVAGGHPLVLAAGSWWGPTTTPYQNQVWSVVQDVHPGAVYQPGSPVSVTYTCLLPGKLAGHGSAPNTLDYPDMYTNLGNNTVTIYHHTGADTLEQFHTLSSAALSTGSIQQRARCITHETAANPFGEVGVPSHQGDEERVNADEEIWFKYVGSPEVSSNQLEQGNHLALPTQRTDLTEGHAWYTGGVEYDYAVAENAPDLLGHTVHGTITTASWAMACRYPNCPHTDTSGLDVYHHAVAIEVNGKDFWITPMYMHAPTDVPLASALTQKSLVTFSLDTTQLTDGWHILSYHTHVIDHRAIVGFNGKQLASEVKIPLCVDNHASGLCP